MFRFRVLAAVMIIGVVGHAFWLVGCNRQNPAGTPSEITTPEASYQELRQLDELLNSHAGVLSGMPAHPQSESLYRDALEVFLIGNSSVGESLPLLIETCRDNNLGLYAFRELLARAESFKSSSDPNIVGEDVSGYCLSLMERYPDSRAARMAFAEQLRTADDPKLYCEAVIKQYKGSELEAFALIRLGDAQRGEGLDAAAIVSYLDSWKLSENPESVESRLQATWNAHGDWIQPYLLFGRHTESIWINDYRTRAREEAIDIAEHRTGEPESPLVRLWESIDNPDDLAKLLEDDKVSAYERAKSGLILARIRLEQNDLTGFSESLASATQVLVASPAFNVRLWNLCGAATLGLVSRLNYGKLDADSLQHLQTAQDTLFDLMDEYEDIAPGAERARHALRRAEFLRDAARVTQAMDVLRDGIAVVDLPHGIRKTLVFSLADISATEWSDFEEAARVCANFAETTPNADLKRQAFYRAGMYSYSDESYDEAVGLFERIIQEFPESRETSVANLMVALCYLEAGSTKEALDKLQNVYNSYGGTDAAAQALYLSATTHLGQLDYERAKELFDLIIDEYPDHQKTGKAREYLENLGTLETSL